jgi:hypothetical protein
LKSNVDIAVEALMVGAVLFALQLIFSVQAPWLYAVPILAVALTYFVDAARNSKRKS